MGMNLAEKMRDRLFERGINFDILATDDNFASVSKVGENAFEMAGVDCKKAEEAILRIINKA